MIAIPPRAGGPLLLFLAACSLAFTRLPAPSAPPPAPPPIDKLLIFVRDWPTYDVELAVTRSPAGSTATLFREPRNGRPRIVLDSIGPAPADAEEVRALLATFDVWALNAANAPGAACKTVRRRRRCDITMNDYSIVMQVERGGEVRVQRYTGLEKDTGNPSARALGDYVLAWAHRLEAKRRR